MMDLASLAARAAAVRHNAYAPYSGFAVGAALLCADGEIFTGVNVENSSYGLTVCAERNALFAAVGAGRREFAALAVYAAPIGADEGPDYTRPCGACLQALAEFCAPDMPVIRRRTESDFAVTPFGELFPYGWTLQEKE